MSKNVDQIYSDLLKIATALFGFTLMIIVFIVTNLAGVSSSIYQSLTGFLTIYSIETLMLGFSTFMLLQLLNANEKTKVVYQKFFTNLLGFCCIMLMWPLFPMITILLTDNTELASYVMVGTPLILIGLALLARYHFFKYKRNSN